MQVIHFKDVAQVTMELVAALTVDICLQLMGSFFAMMEVFRQAVRINKNRGQILLPLLVMSPIQIENRN